MPLTLNAIATASTTSYAAEAAKLAEIAVPVRDDRSSRGLAAGWSDGLVAGASAPSWSESRPVFGKEQLAKPVFLPEDGAVHTVIETGNANDLVEISKGEDRKIHVVVNGKEVWSGTPREFAKVKINTGGGDDTVINKVDGAHIDTGHGSDTVHNYSSFSRINTAAPTTGGMRPIDDDKVYSHGNSNVITTGIDSDHVESTGDYNSIDVGSNTGVDRIVSKGNHNQIVAGNGRLGVFVGGDNNNVNVGVGDQHIDVKGKNNKVHSGNYGLLKALGRLFK